MDIKTKRGISVVLSVINAAGVVITAVAASKEAGKANEEFAKLPKNAKKFDKIKTFVKNYKKSLIFGSATIASGIGSKVISYKVESGLLATATMLGASYNKYKGVVKKTLGVDADKSLVKELMKDDYKKPEFEPENGEKLYYIENVGYFYAKPEKVMSAYMMLNRDMTDNDFYSGEYASGVFTLGEFLASCQAKPLSKNLNESNYNFGWSFDYLSENWNNVWVHMEISEPDENGCSLLYFYEPPIWNPSDWFDYKYGAMPAEKYFEGCNPKVIDLSSDDYTVVK